MKKLKTISIKEEEEEEEEEKGTCLNTH